MAESAENSLFAPPEKFAEQARVKSPAEYEQLYAEAERDPEGFWARLARQQLHWFEPFQEVLRWEEPDVQWFVGGKTNVSYN